MGNTQTIQERIRKHFALKSDAAVAVASSFAKEQRVDAPSRSLWVTATTSDIDLEKEVVVPSGLDTSYFFKLRNIFVNHEYDIDKVVGKLRSAQPRYNAAGEQDGWTCHIRIAPLSKNQYADDILTLAQEGGVAVSIGMEALDFGKPTVAEMKQYRQGSLVPRSIVRKSNWLELSVVGLPCNIQALQIGYGDGGQKAVSELDSLLRKRVDIVDNLLTKGRISAKTAEAIGIPSSDRRKEQKIRRIVVMDS